MGKNRHAVHDLYSVAMRMWCILISETRAQTTPKSNQIIPCNPSQISPKIVN